MLNLWNWAIVGVLISQELASAENEFVFLPGYWFISTLLSIHLKLHNLINTH